MELNKQLSAESQGNQNTAIGSFTGYLAVFEFFRKAATKTFIGNRFVN
jgi:hypothetical protein